MRRFLHALIVMSLITIVGITLLHVLGTRYLMLRGYKMTTEKMREITSEPRILTGVPKETSLKTDNKNKEVAEINQSAKKSISTGPKPKNNLKVTKLHTNNTKGTTGLPKETSLKTDDKNKKVAEIKQPAKMSNSTGSKPKNNLKVTKLHTNSNKGKDNEIFTEQSSGEQQKVIVLTYMRSGSSFTADLIQQHPDVFFMYEPLWSIGHFNRGVKKFDGVLSFLSRPVIMITDSAEYERQQMDIVRNVLDCNLADVDIKTLTENSLDLYLGMRMQERQKKSLW